MLSNGPVLMDDQETLHRRARLRELIRERFEGRTVELLQFIENRTGHRPNQGELSAIQKDNSGKSFGDKKARNLTDQIGMHRRWFDMPLGSALDPAEWEAAPAPGAELHNAAPAPDIKGDVPLISWVQAGHWREAIDNLPVGEGERIATTYKARPHTYALRVRGDSMVAPEGRHSFPDGAIIIVEPEEEARHGSFVIVRQNSGEATFKQLIQDGDTLFLKPLNPRYPIMQLAHDAVICGVVKRMEMDV